MNDRFREHETTRCLIMQVIVRPLKVHVPFVFAHQGYLRTSCVSFGFGELVVMFCFILLV